MSGLVLHDSKMPGLKLREWSSADHLLTEGDRALYLDACLNEAGGDTAFIAKALCTIVRAQSISPLAHVTDPGVPLGALIRDSGQLSP